MSETQSYNEALQRLETIVAELERGGTDLEATVRIGLAEVIKHMVILYQQENGLKSPADTVQHIMGKWL